MLYVDPYKCYFHQRYDGVIFVLPLWCECPPLDLQEVENYDPADFESIKLDNLLDCYFSLSLEPAKQQIFAHDMLRKLRRTAPAKQHVMRYALQLLKVEAAHA